MRSGSDGASLGRRSFGSEGTGGAGTPAPRAVRFSMDATERTPERPRTGDLASSDSVSLKKIVDVFYDKVMADPRLSPYFGSVDVPKLKSHQVKFMALAFGGKELVLDEHPDVNLRRIHWNLIKDKGVTESHWEWFFQHFKEALDDMPEVPEETKARAAASVATTRAYFRPITPEEEGARAAANSISK